MPTPHTVVITSAKTGPDRTVAGVTLTNVQRVDFDLLARRVTVYVEPSAGGSIREFDLSLTATITFANATGVFTITLA